MPREMGATVKTVETVEKENKKRDSEEEWRRNLLSNDRLVRQNAVEFRQTFGVPLTTYFEVNAGFNLVKFDAEVLKSPNGSAKAGYIKKHYGENAHLLICRLLNLDPESLVQLPRPVQAPALTEGFQW